MVEGRLVVRMLGGFEVQIDDRVLDAEAWRRQRAADLVKVLALAPLHRLPRELVMEALWPALGPERAGTNLRKAAHHARAALGTAEGVVLAGGLVVLGPGREISTDVAEFRHAADTALEFGEKTACRQAAALYGELLPDDRYAGWAEAARDGLQRLYRQLLAGGDLWGRLVEVDPVDEYAHQQIIEAHLENGNRAAALRQHEALRVALADQLGVSPNPDSMALYERALTFDGPDVPTPAERARALLAWGVIHWQRQELDEAASSAAAARSLAVDAGLGRELADASELLGLVAYAQGRWKEMFLDEFVSTIRTTPELSSFLLDAHMCMTEFALHEADGPLRIAELAIQILDASEEADSPQGRALGLLLRGEAGLFDPATVPQALEDLVAASELHQKVGSVTGAALALERLAQAETAEGRRTAADGWHRAALDLAHRSAIPKHLLPFVYGGLVETASAGDRRGVVEEAVAVISGGEVCDPCSMSLRVGAVHAYATAGDIDTARHYLTEAERVADMWATSPWKGAVAEATAALRAAQGSAPEEIAGLLSAAVAGYEAGMRRREANRVRTKLAEMAGTVGERSGS